MDEPTTLAAVLGRYLREREIGVQQLEERSGVAKQTITNWLTGIVAHPYRAGNVLRLAAALQLPRVSTNRLLLAAGQPSLERLAILVATEEDDDLLAPWRVTAADALPHPLTEFVGRGAEILNLGELLCQEPVRLLTLTGPGGSGKTRLALQVARALPDVFPDGMYFVALAAVRDPLLVLAAIARALGLADVAGASALERLQGYLRQRRSLFLLDNFEQVLPAGPEVVALLTAAAGVKCLVTSRAALHVGGEHERAVAPLPLPDPTAAIGALRRHPALLLFAARARAVAPRFALTAANAAAVARLCARLDGLPLAIELAAARSKQFTPMALLEQFPSALALSSDGPVDADPRQRTLRATIDWSYQLLGPDEQALFRRLAVFAGGGGLEAVQAIGAAVGAPPSAVQPAFTALCGHSLIQQATDVAGGSRFAMLETIREYAGERLAAGGEEEALRRAHAANYLGMAESAEQYIPDTQQSDWLGRIDRDHDNCRAALTWALARGEEETALRLAGTLWLYWHEFGYFNEGSRWLDATLVKAAHLPATLRLPVLTGAFILAFNQCDYPRAAALGEASLAVAEALDDRQHLALVLMYQGRTASITGDYTRAMACMNRSLGYWRVLGGGPGIARGLSDRASTYIMNGHFQEGEADLLEADRLYGQCNDTLGRIRTVTDRGLAALLAGKIERAIGLLEEGLAGSQPPRYTVNRMYSLCYLGVAYLLGGILDAAVDLLTKSIRLREQTGDTQGLAYCLLGLAGVANRRQQPKRAARLCGAAFAVLEAIGVVLVPGVRPLYDQETGAIQGQLGADVFAAEFAAGHVLPVAEAVAYATGTTPH